MAPIEFEGMTLHAWPAKQVMLLNGGHTKRANSVFPLFGQPMEVAGTVDLCQQVYRAAIQPSFQKFESPCHHLLDPILEAGGYEMENQNSVQTTAMGNLVGQVEHTILLDRSITDAWLDGAIGLGGVTKRGPWFFRDSCRPRLSKIGAGYQCDQSTGGLGCLAWSTNGLVSGVG